MFSELNLKGVMNRNGLKRGLSYFTKKTVFSILIILMVSLSSIKTLDSYVDTYTNQAIQTAAISYATARGINALVSMLQTATVEADVFVVSGSITIGELLDPINDLVERFSSIMTIVLGSLAAQKILLLITSNNIFNYLVIFLGVMTIMSIYLKQQKIFDFIFKAFLLTVFIRFALVLAVMLNGAVDQLFLVDKTQQYDSEISSFKQDIENLSDSQARPPNKNELLQQLSRLKESKEQFESRVSDKNAEYQKVRNDRKKCSWSSYFSNSDCFKLRSKEYHLNRDIDQLNENIADHEELIKTINGTLNEFDSKPKPDSKQLIEVWKDSLPDISINSIERKVQNSISSFMNLMAIYIIKTIVLPLLFFYLVMFFFKQIWRIDPIDLK